MVERDWVGMAPPGVQPELLSSQLFQGFRTPASVLYSHQHLTTLFGAPLQGTMQGAMQGAMQGPMQGTTTAPPTYNPSGPSVLMPPAAPPPAISLLPPSDFRLNVFIPDSNRKFLVVGVGSQRVSNFLKKIEEAHLRFFKEEIFISFITTEAGAVVDGDFVLQRSFQNEDTVRAHSIPLSAAHASTLSPTAPKRPSPVEIACGANNYKRRRQLDPSAPKRPTNAFMRFALGRREAAKSTTEKRGPEFMRMLGQEWAAMSDLEKQPWVVEFELDMQKYNAEKAKYMGGALIRKHAEQPKRVLKRVLEKHGIDASDRDERKLALILREFNEIKDNRRTKKWLVKQLNEIAEKQLMEQLKVDQEPLVPAPPPTLLT